MLSSEPFLISSCVSRRSIKATMTDERQQDERKGPHIEVTIQSIHGISCKSEHNAGHPCPPNHKASVAFKGSAPGMRVTSFTLSGRTGELVVQSNPLEIEKAENIEKPDDEMVAEDIEHDLIATFNDPLTPLSSSSITSLSSSTSCQPHLKIEVPNCRPPLSLSHGKVGLLGGCTPSSPTTEGCNPGKTLFDDDQNTTLSSGQPIAVEIHVCLESNHDILIQEGVAHLLLNGDEHFGTTTFDIPIEAITSSEASSKMSDSIFFQSDARVRVQIRLVNDDHPCKKIDLKLSEELDEMQMNGIVERIRQHDALLVSTAAGKNNHSSAPKRNNTMVRDGSGGADRQKNLAKPQFCNDGGELGYAFQAFFDVFRCRRCVVRGKSKTAGRKQHGQFGLLRKNSTMATTIATRESLGI